MTKTELDAIRERAEAATPGPWFHDNAILHCGLGFEIGRLIGNVFPDIFQRDKNADFIAHAREDIPDLLEDRKSLLAEVERLTTELTDYHHSQKIIDGQMKQNARLRKINDALSARAEKAEVKLAEAIGDIPNDCGYCIHSYKNGAFEHEQCDSCCSGNSHWQWRGLEAGKGGA